MRTLRDVSLLTYYHIMRGVEVLLWVLGGSKYDCSSVTYISKNICLCYYFSTSFLQLGVNYNESFCYVWCIVLYLTQCHSTGWVCYEEQTFCPVNSKYSITTCNQLTQQPSSTSCTQVQGVQLKSVLRSVSPDCNKTLPVYAKWPVPEFFFYF